MPLRIKLLVFSAFTALSTVAACKETPAAPAVAKADVAVAKADAAAAKADVAVAKADVGAAPETAKAPPTNPAPAAITPAKVDVPEKTDAAPSDGKIGVAECDEYIEKYMKCIMERMPDKAKGYMKDAIEQSGKAWKEAASGPSKDGVAAVCKVALTAAKQATTSLGCEW